MIAKMKKLSFLIYHREYTAFLENLRELGVVHVVTRQQGGVKDPGLQEKMTMLSRCRTVAKELETALAKNPLKADAATGSTGLTANDALCQYDQLQAEKNQLEQQRQALLRDRAQLVPWGDFSQERLEQLALAGYTLRFHSCPPKAFKESWIADWNAIEVYSDKQKVYFVTITKNGILPDIDAENCVLPKQSLSEIDAALKDSESVMEAIPDRLSELAIAAMPVLQAEAASLEDGISLDRVRLSGEKLADDRLVLLEGWAPASKVAEISDNLNEKGVFYDIQDPQADDDIPILLSNNRFARLFEPLTKLYMLPTYQELDLTLLFAPFFMLFFGLCLGDIGYGLLMIVALPVFTKLFQLINPQFSKWLVVLFGASTMLCGLLSGSFFGFSIYNLNIPFVQSLKELIYTDNATMFTVSLCIGVVQILFGMAIKAVNLTIQTGFMSALSTIGWFVLLVTIAVSVLAGFSFTSPVVLGILIAAGICIFLLNSPGKNPLLNIGLGLWDTYNMATGLLGDVLSYVRLFALGLSGGILANVFNSMAIGMKPDNPVAGFIVMALIFVIGHALNIFMNILGAIVHPMRLTFVEFFKNAGYTGGGTEYTPFSRKTEIAK